jgi:hypothetical protein
MSYTPLRIDLMNFESLVKSIYMQAIEQAAGGIKEIVDFSCSVINAAGSILTKEHSLLLPFSSMQRAI